MDFSYTIYIILIPFLAFLINGLLKKRSSKKTSKVKSKKQTISAMQLAGELYDLNNDLSDSRRKMGRAMKYIAPRKERQLTRLESKPVYSTVDFEQAADSAPSDLRIQRQLGLHYEVNGNWSFDTPEASWGPLGCLSGI